MLVKLAPVVAKMDSERSRASVSRLEGDRWISQNVVNYKPYVAPKEVPDMANDRGEKGKVKQELEGL